MLWQNMSEGQHQFGFTNAMYPPPFMGARHNKQEGLPQFTASMSLPFFCIMETGKLLLTEN